ncbi:MAG TPA: hypothetical protein VK489_02170, partial [Ferruginibacter sp.]|nr:hypothetical protein [Ferruginibacter sp.]
QITNWSGAIAFMANILFTSYCVDWVQFFNEMLSIGQCKKVLNKTGKQFKEEEIAKLREVLYQIAQMDYNQFKKQNENDKERNYLYQSLN